jgi:hypothetical protein
LVFRLFTGAPAVLVLARALLCGGRMRSPRGRFDWILPLVLSASGCLPFAVPPARVETGIGTRLYTRDPSNGALGPQSTRVLRGAIHPLQLRKDPANRLLDVGLGYRGEWLVAVPSPALHGPYAELGLYPVRASLSRRLRLRWGGYASGDALLSARQDPGFGATLGTLLEFSGETLSGNFSRVDTDSAVFGTAQGQWAVGLFASTAVREVDDDFSQSVVTGMSVRLPLVVGVACCVWPKFGQQKSAGASTQSGANPSRSRPARRKYELARPRRRP